MYFLGLSLVFALGAQNQNPYALHKAMNLTWEDSISLFGRYEYKNAAIRINEKFYKIEGNKAIPSAVTLRGKPHSMDDEGNLSSTRDESIQIDTYELGKSGSALYPDNSVRRMDKFLLTTHAVTDLYSGHSIDFPNEKIVTGVIKHNVLYIVLHGAKTEIGVIKHYLKKDSFIDYDSSIKLERISFYKPDSFVDGIATLENGFLISMLVQGRERHLIRTDAKGVFVTEVATEEIKPYGSADNDGYQVPRLVSFDKGKKFLWATEQALWYGEEKALSVK
jgi:hypothetical protein